MYDFDYHEYLSLHKIDGKWLIVNKMISRRKPVKKDHVVPYEKATRLLNIDYPSCRVPLVAAFHRWNWSRPSPMPVGLAVMAPIR